MMTDEKVKKKITNTVGKIVIYVLFMTHPFCAFKDR